MKIFLVFIYIYSSIAEIIYINSNYQGKLSIGTIDNPFINLDQFILNKPYYESIILIFQSNVVCNDSLLVDFELHIKYILLIYIFNSD